MCTLKSVFMLDLFLCFTECIFSFCMITIRNSRDHNVPHPVQNPGKSLKFAGLLIK